MSPVTYHKGGFPPSDINWLELVPLLGPTAAAVARYDSMLRAIPNSNVLTTPLATHEAVLSSRIEGTIASMGEVLEFEAGQDISPSGRKEDFKEILNYRRALFDSEQRLATFPLSQRVIFEAHHSLLQGTRGQDKTPGSYRRSSNWIGRPGCGIADARYIPPSADYILDAMSAWERYLHNDNVPDRLVQLAVLHAEFEAIHPFLDGNGRIGRMIIPLLMWQWDIIFQPRFYISAYLEANQDEYYEGLLSVSRDGDWTKWIRFFLKALASQAKDNFTRAKKILSLYDQLKHRLPGITRSPNAIRALDWIFENPIFLSSDFANELGVSSPTARRLIGILRDKNIVKRLRSGSGRRASIFVIPDLLNIVDV